MDQNYTEQNNNVMNNQQPVNNGYAPVKPDNFMVWAILCTIFCCLPFGIASIINANKVDSLWAMGDYQGAQTAAQNARKWFKWGIICGIIAYIFYIIFGIIGGVGAAALNNGNF